MNIKNIEYKIKHNRIWRSISLIANCLLNICWRLTYGFRATLWYVFFIKGTRNHILKKSGLQIIHEDDHFTNFATWLADHIPDKLIELEIEKMEKEPVSNSNSNWFSTDIIKLLDEETKLEILRFALNDRNINMVCSYLKFVPKLTTISVLLNKSSKENPLGSQRWHRDWFNHKGLNIFTALTDINEVRGMYSAIGLDIIPRFSEICASNQQSNLNAYDRDRISDNQMKEYINNDNIQNLKGPPGTTALVDSGWVYHKGGFLKEGYRIMIEISYQSEQKPPASVVESVVDTLDLHNSNELCFILNTRLKRYMVQKRKSGVKLSWRFLWLSRKLTYIYRSM